MTIKQEVIKRLKLKKSEYNPALLKIENGNYCDAMLIDVTYNNQYIGIYNPRTKTMVE